MTSRAYDVADRRAVDALLGSWHNCPIDGWEQRTDWLLSDNCCYRLGSYRIATAPEPNSSRLTSFRSTRFDNPANNVGP